VSGGSDSGNSWGFRVLGIISLLLAPVFFGLFAMSGGGDCDVSAAKECQATARTFGVVSLLFIGLAGFSFWKIFVANRGDAE
jgi:hypothetical protein